MHITTVLPILDGMILRSTPYTLQLRHAFTLASGSRTTTPCVLVEIEADGLTGYGEASLPPYLGETQEGTLAFLDAARSYLPAGLAALRDGGLPHLHDLLARLDRLCPGRHPAKAAIDIALHDLLGKAVGLSVRRLRGITADHTPSSSYTISIGDENFLRARLREAEGFPVLKVKLGRSNDREIIETIRGVTETPIRVDANQGWTDREEAARLTEWLAGRNVELVEQPFPLERVEDTAWLKKRSPIPLVADESIARLSDLGGAAEAFDGVNVKLMKCTGIAEAHAMIDRAHGLGMRVMLGCMTETSCGISAAAQIAPLADWIDLDGALLVANDPFTGTMVQGGGVVPGEGAGIGAKRSTA